MLQENTQIMDMVYKVGSRLENLEKKAGIEKPLEESENGEQSHGSREEEEEESQGSDSNDNNNQSLGGEEEEEDKIPEGE